MRRKRPWRRVGYFFLGLGLAYIVGCYYLASKYVRPGTQNAGPPPDGFAQSVGYNSWVSDTLQSGKPVFVLVHGYGGSQYGWRDVASALRAKGFGVVIPALPGHDNRQDEKCGFGISESKTILEGADWIREKAGKDAKIILVGISLGGAASWLAAEQDPNFYAVATEGSFARLEPATRSWFNRKTPGATTYLAPVIWFAKRMSGVDPSTVNPVEAAAKWRGKPALVIHGDTDELFPIENGKQLAEAAGCKLWTVKGAPHAHCSSINLEKYVEQLVQLTKQ